jgi:hypothetical protein
MKLNVFLVIIFTFAAVGCSNSVGREDALPELRLTPGEIAYKSSASLPGKRQFAPTPATTCPKKPPFNSPTTC